jgi:predicted lipoprotein with Yx(FWY)xxD motif
LRPPAVGLIVAVAGFAVAGLAGIAAAKTFTLNVAKNAQVTNTKHVTVREPIAVTSRGMAVYTLSGDSMHHQKCTNANSCFTFWPPVKVASAKNLNKATGISGKLGVWHRDGFFQLTLNGHPLYMFAADKHKDDATGEGINGFHGIWHVTKASVSKTTSTTTTSTSSGTSTSTTMPYPVY